MFINAISPIFFRTNKSPKSFISFNGLKPLREDCFEKKSQNEKTHKEAALRNFKRLALKDIKKYRLIKSAIHSTIIDKGVSEKTFADFVDELVNLKNIATLKKAIDANVRFRLTVSDDPSSYSIYVFDDFPAVKEIKICQKSDGTNMCYQLSHELGHVFDYETQIKDNGLTSSLEYNLTKEDGCYKKSKKFIPNTQKPYIDDYEKGSKTIKYKGAILQNASFSKEFEDAFLKDYINMLEIDKQKGLSEGTTFSQLLSDWDIDSYFAYYLGAEPDEAEIKDASKLKKELFAQLCAFSTNGHTARKGFDEKVLLYFPNTYEFVNNIIKKTL